MRYFILTLVSGILLLNMLGCTSPQPDVKATDTSDVLKLHSFDVRHLITVMPDREKALANVIEGVNKRLKEPSSVGEVNGLLLVKATDDQIQQVRTYLEGRNEQIQFDWQVFRSKFDQTTWSKLWSTKQ